MEQLGATFFLPLLKCIRWLVWSISVAAEGKGQLLTEVFWDHLRPAVGKGKYYARDEFKYLSVNITECSSGTVTSIHHQIPIPEGPKSLQPTGCTFLL